MRYNITVHVPQTLDVSYTLFAKGFNIEIPQLSEDESEYTFKFLGGTVLVLFYNFGRFKKAYVVTGWEDERDGSPVNLPGVEGDLCILFSVRGRRYLILDKVVKYLTRDDEYDVFQLPLSFWYKLGVLIENRKTRKSYINNILLLYRSDGKDFFYSQKEEDRDNLENKIISFCNKPRTAKEIADNFGYKNERAFAKKFLDILVQQDLLIFENRKYYA